MSESRKLVLAIDYNNLSIRNMYTVKHTEDGITSYDTDEECAVYGRYLIKDIYYLAKLFNPSEIYLLGDSKDPWRKHILPEYKANRKKDDTVNMQRIFQTMEEVAEVLKNYGMCRVVADNAEADDLVAMLKKCMKVEGSNMVFVTSDADWLQLTEFDTSTTQFFVSYNPIINGPRKTRQLSMTQECYDWLHSDVQIFGNTNYVSRTKLLGAIENEKSLREAIVSPNTVLLNKVVSGDQSDNIPGVYENSGKTGKRMRITDLKRGQLFECCGFPETVEELALRVDDGSFAKAFKEALHWDVTTVDFQERLSKQRKLVELDPKLFPVDIRKSFVDSISKIDRRAIAYKGNSIRSASDILTGTKFQYVQRTSNGAKMNSIFKTLVERPIFKPEDL